MSLLDTIKANLASSAAPSAVGGIQDTTAQIQQLNQAKTGKVGTAPTTPHSTNLQEQISTGQAALGAAEIQNQAKMNAEKLAQQEKAQTEAQTVQSKQLDEAALAMFDNYANQSAKILQDFQQQGRALDFKKDAAKVEQLGIATRLANDKYVSQLEQEGARARLDTEIGFDEAIQQMVWDDDKDLLDHDLAFKQALNGKANEWNEYMNNMQMEDAMDAATKERKAAEQRMIWTGGASAVSSMVGFGAGGGFGLTGGGGGGTSTSNTMSNPMASSNATGAARFEKEQY